MINNNILSLLSMMYNIMETNGLITDEIKEKYKNTTDNYHDTILQELDNITKEDASEAGQNVLRELSNPEY